MDYVEVDTELLLLAASESGLDHQEAMDRLMDATPAELRTLRTALTRLDAMLDALALDKHLKRD